MGIGTERSLSDDIEWFSLDDVEERGTDRFVARALAALRIDPLWRPGEAIRVLLVDLDNLRVQPSRLRGRIAMAVALARQADLACFAGQDGAVRRALPWLDEYADTAVEVGRDHDEADLALLAAAATVANDDVQFIVLSNDGIFAQLAERGLLLVLSPGAASLSDELAAAADRVVDIQHIEAGLTT